MMPFKTVTPGYDVNCDVNCDTNNNANRDAYLDVNMTQPGHEWDIPRYMRWDYERLGLEPSDIDGFLSEQFNTAQVLIRDSRSFRRHTAELSRRAKDQSDFLRLLAERRVMDLAACEERYEDLSYQVPLASLLDEESRNALIDFVRNRSILATLYAVGSSIRPQNCGRPSSHLSPGQSSRQSSSQSSRQSSHQSLNRSSNHSHEDEHPQASDLTIAASKVQIQRPHTPSGHISTPVSDPYCHTKRLKSAKCDMIPEESRKRQRPLEKLVDDSRNGPVKRQKMLPRKYMQSMEYDALANKPTAQSARDDEESETNSSLRRTSLSSVSTTISDTNSTSTGFLDHEFCCCDDEKPPADEYNAKPPTAPTVEQVHKHGCVSVGVSVGVSGSSSTGRSDLKTGKLNPMECCHASGGLNKNEEHIHASHSHKPLPSPGDKATEETVMEPGDVSTSSDSTSIVR